MHNSIEFLYILLYMLFLYILKYIFILLFATY